MPRRRKKTGEGFTEVEKSSIIGGSNSEHAHCTSACLLRLRLLYRSCVLDHTSACKIRERKEEMFRRVTAARTETTLQVSRLTLNGACVLMKRLYKYCTSYKNSCWRPGTNLRVFQTGSSSRVQRHYQLGKSEDGKRMSSSSA